jgi:TPR repeat protein
VLLATGRGAPKDMATALSLLDKGCGLHGANACGNLVYFELRYGPPKDTQPDYARGEPVLRASCEEGNPRACHALGWMLEKGIGIAVDHTKAATLLKSACDQGACEKAP